LLEVILDNRNGTLWDISGICSEISWKTSRTGKPSSVDLTFISDGLYQDKAFTVNTGDVLRIRKDGQGLFWGYVFEVESGRDEQVSLKAYDQLRYLNESDTYVRINVTADQVIRDNCAVGDLKLGTLAPTGYVIPKVLEDGQKRLDIIYRALDNTMIATGRLYVLYDDYGSLMLRDVEDMTIDLILGDGSLVYDYRIKRSIDSDTYNRIKLVQDNKESGKRDVYITQDSSTIARWGRLQYYQKVDDKLNPAQVQAIMDGLIQLKNRETQQFKLDALGFVGMRAGVKVQVTISKQKINSYFLVDECTHQFSGEDHTMKLTLRVYG